MNDIMKIVNSLEESSLSIKCVTETIKNEAKKQKWGFLGILSGTLGATLLASLLIGKEKIKAGEDTIRVGEKF